MHTLQPRIERALGLALNTVSAGCPPRLMQAMRHAVFAGGARVRPALCLLVARACGEDQPHLAEAAAAAVELLHCASLVHDDLPCFDDADTRRGRPSVQRAFGEPLAVLAGDGLIVLAFDTIARAAHDTPARLPALVQVVSRGVGPQHGIIGGQAWESEARVELGLYHATKTAALFEAAVGVGAVAAGADPSPWQPLGRRLGEAYQIADDLHDATARGSHDKPVGQDESRGRPNAVAEYGLEGALRQLNVLRMAAIEAMPETFLTEEIVHWVNHVSFRLVPPWLQHAEAASPLRSAISA